MSGVNQELPQRLQQTHHQNNGWSGRGEKLVRYWQEECRLYAWIYEQNVTYYSRLNRTLGIASIGLSAITGTTLFNQSASDPDATSSNILIGLGVSSIASTILSGLKELLDLNSLITQNTNAARENSSIVMDIDEQLNMDRAERMDGREFLKSIKDRKNSLIQNGPIIPSRQWKQVHKKIQSKEQLGFLNREVFNEYLEQSVDINKLHFGAGIGNTVSGAFTNNPGLIDYGTTSNNSAGSQSGYLDGSNAADNKMGSVVIDIPSNSHTLHKRAGLSDKLVFYGGVRLQIIPIIPAEPTPDDLKTLEKEIENIQPRCAARKAILENQYELERLLSKTGELKNKDRQQITSLRDKARVYRETYHKIAGDNIADHNGIINIDCTRVARIIKAYRDGNLTEPELFRIMQLDLMEIDKETFEYETRIHELINKTRSRIDYMKAVAAEKMAQQAASETETRYPFRANTSGYIASTDVYESKSFELDNSIQQKLVDLQSIRQLIISDIEEIQLELRAITDRIESSDTDQELQENCAMQLSKITERKSVLEQEYISIMNKITELEHAVAISGNTNMNISTSRLQPVTPNISNPVVINTSQTAQMTYSSVPPTNMRQSTQISREIATTPAKQQPRPPSTVPSDDEFIENMIGDNLCTKQLQDMIKPIALPNSPPTSPRDSDSSSKLPKRRSSKYDAQMRYQTARIT